MSRVYAWGTRLEPMSADNDDELRDEDERDEIEFDELTVELLRRLYRQQPVDWDDYYRRYPHHADELRRLRPMIEAVAKYLRHNPK